MPTSPTTIAQLLSGITLAAPLSPSLASRTVSGLHFDSRLVSPGDLFFAFSGANADARSFAPSAVERGAVAVVSDLPAPPGLEPLWILVPHGRQALALAARQLFGDPSRSALPLFGVTGTNGKTTSTYILASILEAAGYSVGLFGTIEYRLGSQRLSSINTTPESIDLYRHFAALSALPRPAVAMEVSSHALALGRVWGLHFQSAIFTNLTRDHL
ncbi:MAG: Mur ligase family protein, partial [Acidobacteriota bacterium]